MMSLKPFFAILLVITLAACSPTEAASEQAAEPTQNVSALQSAAHPKPRVNLLLDTELLHQAQIALAKRPEFSGSHVQVFQKINFFDGVRPRIELAAQNPALPETLTFYTYENGKWTPSEAEDISHIKNLKANLFALESIDFRQASQFARTWQAKAQSVQAAIDDPYYVAFVFLPKQQKRFWHTATLEATGKQFYLSFHEDGSVWEFKDLATNASLEEQ